MLQLRKKFPPFDPICFREALKDGVQVVDEAKNN